MSDQLTAILPVRPRVLPGLPVVHRATDTVQFGINPAHAVVLSGMSSSLAKLIAALDGRYTVDELLTLAHGEVDRAALAEALSALTSAGVVEDAESPPGTDEFPLPRLEADATAWALRTGRQSSAAPVLRQAAAIVVHGDGRLAVAVACLLAAVGVGWVHIAAAGKVQAADLGSGYLPRDVGEDRAKAAAAAVLRTSPETTVRALPPHRNPDLVVITDVNVPDPVLVAGLLATGVPHLLVRVREGVGVVGPLVFPGHSSCLRCADLHRTDIDPVWPTVAAQLVGRPQPADLVCVQASASLATAQALLALEWPQTRSAAPATWNTTLELDASGAVLRRRQWSVHPECTCGATS